MKRSIGPSQSLSCRKNRVDSEIRLAPAPQLRAQARKLHTWYTVHGPWYMKRSTVHGPWYMKRSMVHLNVFAVYIISKYNIDRKWIVSTPQALVGDELLVFASGFVGKGHADGAGANERLKVALKSVLT